MIGQECCHLLAHETNQLILLGRDNKKLEDLAHNLDSINIDIYKLDFAAESEITSCIESVIDNWTKYYH